MKYFRLNPEVMFEQDKNQSVLYNLLTKELIFLKPTLSHILLIAEANRVIEENELFDHLKKLGWGVYVEKPIYVDKLRKFNNYSMKRLIKEKSEISQAIIQITNRCKQRNIDCKNAFCPVCLCRNTGADELGVRQWIEYISQIIDYGCKIISITGGDVFEYEGVHELLNYLNQINATVIIHCHRFNEVINMYQNLRFNILVDTNESFKSINDQVEIKCGDRVSFLTYDENVYKHSSEKSIILIRTNEPSLKKEGLIPVDANIYFDRQVVDICLNGKLTVLSNGNVVPCLGKPNEVIGNISVETLPQIIKELSIKYWNVGVNDCTIFGKCSKCSVRYACSKCRFSTNQEQCFTKEG